MSMKIESVSIKRIGFEIKNIEVDDIDVDKTLNFINTLINKVEFDPVDYIRRRATVLYVSKKLFFERYKSFDPLWHEIRLIYNINSNRIKEILNGPDCEEKVKLIDLFFEGPYRKLHFYAIVYIGGHEIILPVIVSDELQDDKTNMAIRPDGLSPKERDMLFAEPYSVQLLDYKVGLEKIKEYENMTK